MAGIRITRCRQSCACVLGGKAGSRSGHTRTVVGRQAQSFKIGGVGGKHNANTHGGMYTRTCCFRAGCGGVGTCESSLLRTGGGPERGVPAAAADLRLMGVDAIVAGAPPTGPKIIQKI
jgi:hypothetical protein